jgi:hypothetical protein
VVLLRSENSEEREGELLVLLTDLLHSAIPLRLAALLRRTDLLHLAVPQHLGDWLQGLEFRSYLWLLTGSDNSR